MPTNRDTSARAFQELVLVLEEAVQRGAYGLNIEFEDRQLIVYYMFGNTGVGAARIPKELERPIINEIVKRSGLSRKLKGKMNISLLGNDCEVIVEQSESFGDPVFNLVIKESKKKSGQR